MKRSEALQSLSRDHHQGLHVALRLKRATVDSAADATEAFLAFWETEGREHFRMEEEILLPTYTRHRPVDEPAVVRVLTEHVELRRLAADVGARRTPSLSGLHDLGRRLEQHIRHEERVLFPAVEAALTDAELSDMAEAFQQAESA